jgi:restriction endonuclease, S subunit
MARLDEICAINMGQSPDSSTYNEDSNGLPFFQGNADFGEIYPAVRMWCSEPTKIAQEKDVLISVRAPIGALNIANCECCIGRGLAALTVNEDICAQEYLWHVLSSKVDELNSKGTGSTFKAINKKTLSEIEIPLPPLDEQRKIAAVLDKVSDLIAKRRQQLDKLDELVKSRFIELFGDPLVDDGRYPKRALGALAEVGSSKRIFEKEYVAEGVPFYRTKEIVELSKGNRITTELFITRERYDEIRDEYGMPQKGDLLISAVGTIGVIWIVDGQNDFYFKDGNLLRVAATERFAPTYLKHLLESLIGAYKQEMSSGTAYAALTISALKEMQVYEVPLAEQEQFAAFVAQTDKSKLAVQQGLQELEILKKSLMQEYFE